MLDVKKCLADCEEKMEMSVLHLEDVLSHIRAGKANIHILDEIRVNSYGSMVPLNNVSAITTPDARTIAIKPWDKKMFPIIEKAIIDSNVGIMPENNGEVIRLGIPPLTEDRRRDLTKQCNKEAEECKVAIRNARRDGQCVALIVGCSCIPLGVNSQRPDACFILQCARLLDER